MCIPTGCWHRAIDSNGEPRDGAEVAELTEFVDLDSWPDSTRLIISSNEHGEWNQAWAYNLENGDLRLYQAAEWDILGVGFSSTGKF